MDNTLALDNKLNMNLFHDKLNKVVKRNTMLNIDNHKILVIRLL